MNRAEKIRAIAAYEALAKALRASLADDAVAEIEREGTAPTWRAPGFAVSVTTSNPTVAVTDTAAFLAWVQKRYPTEVYEIREARVRAAWQSKLLAAVLKRGAVGDPVTDEVIPGIEIRDGGAFRSVTLTPDRDTRERLALVATQYAAGVRELPRLEAGDE